MKFNRAALATALDLAEAARRPLAELRADGRKPRGTHRSPAIALMERWAFSAPLRAADLQGVDAAAFRHAARYLAARFGERNKATGHHGGWDAMGHYGVSPADVRRAWFLAGCRASQKFFILLSDAPEGITSGMFRIARKGDTAQDLLRLRRALRRHATWGVDARAWSRAALMAAGRLSAPLHSALIRALPADLPAGVLRVRDLPWQAVADAQRQIADDPSGRVRAALTGDRGALAALSGEPLLPPVAPTAEHTAAREQRLSALLAPQYGGEVPVPMARRLALGERPVDLAAGELSAKEAHAWLASGAALPAGEWIAERLCRDAGLILRADATGGDWFPRERRVAEWLVCQFRRLGEDGLIEALNREHRGGYLPDGQQEVWRAADIIDAVAGVDIARLQDGITAVCDRTRARGVEARRVAAAAQHEPLTARPAWESRLPKAVRNLRTASALIEEGAGMGHCVGMYDEAVRTRRAAILAVATRHGRSTVEISPDGRRVIQHRGPANREPHRRHVQLIRAWVARNNRRV